MLILWIKAFHVIAMVTWFSALFYLPRLFVYHAMATDTVSIERFKIMERKLYYGIATPGAIFTIALGIWLLSFNWQTFIKMPWMHLKLGCVMLLLLYHVYLNRLRRLFHIRHYHHVFYRILNEVPVILLSLIVIAVIVKPFG